MNRGGESMKEVNQLENNLYYNGMDSSLVNTVENEEQFPHQSISVNHINNEDQLLFLDKKDTGPAPVIASTSAQVVRPFKCYLCGLLFDRISQLDNHRRSVHNQERCQICQICGKGFFRQNDLKTHLNIHLGTNRCMCEVCGRKFNHMSNLIRHSRTHSGVKPYPCTICGKRFTQINTLARHKAIHERGVETLDCCFCDKRYKSQNGFREHLRKLHGFMEKSNSEENGRIVKRQHYCKICGESFQFVELLRTHETGHQNLKMLHCKSCDQKFEKTDEIKDHSCGRLKTCDVNETIKSRKPKFTEDNANQSYVSEENESILTQLGETRQDPKALSDSAEIYTSMEFPRLNGPSNNNESDYKLSQNIDTGSEKPAENKQTKETIVYITSEQLAHMNTEQVVSTANHFLHEHLMELAAESSLQTENVNCRECDEETVVSEMINSCWKEIEMPAQNVNVSEMADKRDSITAKNNTQSIIYIHALEKDGLIFLNDNGNLLSNVTPDLTQEMPIDTKPDIGVIKDSSSHGELENIKDTKIGEDEYVEKYTSYLVQNDTQSRKLSYGNTSKTNFREQSNKLERYARPVRESKIQITRNYYNHENSNDNLLIENKNRNIFNELIQNNSENFNAAVSKSSENEEPRLRLVQTEHGEQFYELLMTNCSDKMENSLESDKITAAPVNDNFKSTQIDSAPESLLKLVQLENGQRVLELMKESETSDNVEGSESTTVNDRIFEASVLKDAEDEKNESKNSVQNKSETIFYLAQNNKDTLIDFFEIETLNAQQQNNFQSVSAEIIENVSQTNFNDLQMLNRNKDSDSDESQIGNDSCEELLGLIQSNPPKHNEKTTIESKKNIKEEAPMVRLVQNEDGAQFFELIRGDLEFDETQDFEFVQNNELDEQRNVVLDDNIFAINETIKLEIDTMRKKKQKIIVKKYHCDVCRKSFSKGYNYRQHIGTHFADQQKFKCKECGMLFAWKSTLNKHMVTHRAGGQQKFVCEICPKVYTTLSQVNEHVKRDHLKERNHKCTTCAKTFFKKFDLKIHMRTHTKERPYECRVCYKSFHHQSHIIRHERIHSGERPYACNICEKTFTQLGSLKNHRQRHQELKIDILDYQMDEDDPLPRTTF